ncbi:MAG: NAD-binding protein [Gammaproteobacteria bacterium]|nr:NAD-binding protein [Gammaproteobacteria bacterium]
MHHIDDKELEMQTAGVIGLGVIGSRVAQCLQREGRLAAVYDLRSEAAAQAGVAAFSVTSPAELARRCNVVLVAVVNSAQAREVLLGEQGLLSQAHAELTVVLLSTVSLDDLEQLRGLVAAAGVDLVDCGVTGGSAVASKGLACLVGANDSSFTAVLPVLRSFSDTVLHMGGAGTGMAAKIVRNVIVYTTWCASCEAAALGRAAGVDLAMLDAAIEASQASLGSPLVWMANGPATDAEVTARETVAALLNKDLDAALALADRVDVSLQITQLTRRNARAVLGLEPLEHRNGA